LIVSARVCVEVERRCAALHDLNRQVDGAREHALSEVDVERQVQALRPLVLLYTCGLHCEHRSGSMPSPGGFFAGMNALAQVTGAVGCSSSLNFLFLS
jgi:hypothetical protein